MPHLLVDARYRAGENRGVSARAGGPGSKDPTSGESDFVVVANRLPIDMVRLPDGSTTFKRSPGGLVTR